MAFIPASSFTPRRSQRPLRSRRPSPRPTPCRPRRVTVTSLSDPPQTTPTEARIQLWREVESLKQSLRIAVNAERFSDAARIRDRIESLSLADDYFRTNKDLERAVEEQRFGDAARLRDILKGLQPPPGMAVLRGEQTPQEGDMPTMNMNDVSNASSTVTEGIRVLVESTYMAEQSLPEQNRFLFSYKVIIKNEGKHTCQLVSRHWIISSAVGPSSEVKGAGVVGRQPVLEPGDSFEYTSACPITGPLSGGQCILGNMKGKYNFCKGDTGNVRFSVDIDPFYFKLPYHHHREGSSGPGFPWAKPGAV